MRDETFFEEHEVELSEEDRALRGRQAARLVVALEKHQAEAKETKKKLADREKELDAGILEVSRAAELGKEKRPVECREYFKSGMVLTERLDTLEVIGSRAATKSELEGLDRKRGDAAKAAVMSPQTLEVRLRNKILEHCAKPRTESALLKALAKDFPRLNTPEHKTAVDLAVEAGVVVEQEGKLLVVNAPPAPPVDDAVVEDDYNPLEH